MYVRMYVCTYVCMFVCIYVCLCPSVCLSVSVCLYVANANLRLAGINLFRNTRFRMRVLSALELICNCDCEFLLFKN